MQNLHSIIVLFASTLVAHHDLVPGPGVLSVVHLVYCLPFVMKGNTHSLPKPKWFFLGAETEMARLKKHNGDGIR